MEVLSFESGAQWEQWLETHHAQADGAWLKVGKKGSRRPAIGIGDAGDIALCFGWIDSVRKAFDDDCFLQRYSPRRPGGSWSRVNVERVEALTAAGRMRPAGLAEVEAAMADGRWAAAYESQANATVPADLAQALAADKAAGEHFARLGKTDRYAVILHLAKARTQKGRASRLDKMISELAAGRKPRP